MVGIFIILSHRMGHCNPMVDWEDITKIETLGDIAKMMVVRGVVNVVFPLFYFFFFNLIEANIPLDENNELYLIFPYEVKIQKLWLIASHWGMHRNFTLQK
jgi:hypothetical protein